VTDAELLAGFEDGSLEAFPHREHVRVAWLIVRRDGMPRALESFPERLRAFALKKGTPNLYHQTITWAFLLLLAERLGDAQEAFDAFAARNPALLAWNPSLLDRYYKQETLASERARSLFLLPDRLAEP
jgi:hypothetical protein